MHALKARTVVGVHSRHQRIDTIHDVIAATWREYCARRTASCTSTLLPASRPRGSAQIWRRLEQRPTQWQAIRTKDMALDCKAELALCRRSAAIERRLAPYDLGMPGQMQQIQAFEIDEEKPSPAIHNQVAGSIEEVVALKVRPR